MSISFTSAAAPSTITSAESEVASCGTHITLPCEVDHATDTARSSEKGEQSSLDPSLASSCTTAMPECNSTQCNTPLHATDKAAATAPAGAAAARALPPLHRVPEIYQRAAEDVEVRAAIAVNAKHVFHALTGFDVDEILDLLYVKETWFSTEVVIHALCLVNRLSFRFPSWCEHAIESDTDASSCTDSPVRGCSSAAATSTLPRLCSSTSSEFSHHDAMDAMSEHTFESFGRSLARSRSASTNSLGEVFTRSNSPRCIMALLLLSSKFHGDIVYNTASLSNAMNAFREEQLKVCGEAPLGQRRKPLLRVLPATLGQCEKRLFSELGFTAFVHKEEYQHCETLALRGL